jgi:hypothetical protein
LHWSYPSIKLFIGGRAQQVYREDTFRKYHQFISEGKVEELTAQKIQLIAFPYSRRQRFDVLINNAITAGWITIFFDGSNVLLVDPNWPESNNLLKIAIANQLVYPNQEIAQLSQQALGYR